MRLLWLLFLLCAASLRLWQTQASGNSESLLKAFLRARCGPSGAGVWVYEGSLVDPLNGNEIAQVQGVELVRCLAVTDASSAQRERYRRRCGDLGCADAIGGVPTSANAATSSSARKKSGKSDDNNESSPSSSQVSSSTPPLFDYAGTLLSRKLFCYTTPSSSSMASSSGSPSLLRKVRLRPTSPERTIPLSQAATVYDTATTYCQYHPSSSSSSRGGKSSLSSSSPVNWLVHTEHPDGRTIWGVTQVVLPEGAAEPASSASSAASQRQPHKLEFSVYARPQPLWRQTFDLARILASSSPAPAGASAVVSPPRRQWIQLGGSPASQEAGKFGARETYQYTMLNQHTSKPSCQVRYTRYGEGPLWYGPGRLCTLELTGRRVEHWSELPPQVAKVAYERVVGFLSVHSPVPQDDTLARRTVEWFRGKGAAKLQITPVDSQDPSTGGSGWLWQGVQDKASSWWERCRGATSVSSGTTSDALGAAPRQETNRRPPTNASRRPKQ